MRGGSCASRGMVKDYAGTNFKDGRGYCALTYPFVIAGLTRQSICLRERI
jgi:hypothetical protein